jgi:predicted Zn finger-like uncharacterized protein
MSSVTVHCPHCQQSYSVDGSLVGHEGRCKGCGRTFALAPSTDTSGSLAASGLPSTLTSEPSPTALAQAFPLPETFARFVITQRLGSGAFGTVYRATDPVLGREVALKVPQAGLLESPSAAERFLREARAAAQLRHPNIVTLFETGIDRGDYYIATEFIDGTTLGDAVSEAKIDPRRAAEVAAALAEALQYAHAQGIVHRDVKPANVMLDRNGQPHLMDFGLARFEGASGEKLTQDGTILGTPAYMAPEQAAASGTETTAASDRYSLGATLYELLTGKTPFSGPPEIVIFNLVHRDPPASRSLKPEIPPDLETICLKAMAKLPSHRYRSCQEVTEDLRRWLQEEPIRARRAATPAKLGRWLRGHRVAAGLAAFVLAGRFTLAGWIVACRARRLDRPPAVLSETVVVGNPAAPARPVSEAGVEEASPPTNEPNRRVSDGDVPRTHTPRAKLTLKKMVATAAAKAAPKPDPDAKKLDPNPKRPSRFQLTPLKGHYGTVHCVAFSPDGKRIVSGGQDRTVRL